jgi:hypothetical protein
MAIELLSVRVSDLERMSRELRARVLGLATQNQALLDALDGGGGGSGDATSLRGIDLDPTTFGAPSDGDAVVYDTASGKFVLAQPSGAVTAPLDPADDGKVATASGGDLTYSHDLTLSGFVQPGHLRFDHAAGTLAASGDIRADQQFSIRGRDGAADVNLFSFGSGTGITIGHSALPSVALSGPAVLVGATPATAGAGLRMTDDSGIYWRDPAGAGTNRLAMRWSADALIIGSTPFDTGPDSAFLGADSLIQMGTGGTSQLELDVGGVHVRDVLSLGASGTLPGFGDVRIAAAVSWAMFGRNAADTDDRGLIGLLRGGGAEILTLGAGVGGASPVTATRLHASTVVDVFIGTDPVIEVGATAITAHQPIELSVPVGAAGMATAGTIRGSNTWTLVARDNADTNDVTVFSWGATNLTIGDGVLSSLELFVATDIAGTVAGATRWYTEAALHSFYVPVALAAPAASTGTLRAGTAFSLYGLDGSTNRVLLNWAGNALTIGGPYPLTVQATDFIVGPVHNVAGGDETTTATPLPILTFAPGVNTAGRIAVVVTARQDGTQTVNIYSLAQSYETDGSGNVTLRGTLTVVSEDEDTAGWDCTIDASTTSLRVVVTGEASTTIQWLCAGQVMVA